jgi:hypothetical protein
MDSLVKPILTLGIWMVACIPVWIFLAARYMLAPEGFWQNFILLGFGVVVLGVFQLIGFILGAMATIVVWGD